MSVFPCRWKNWWVRGILTLAMISFFFFIIYLGPMVLMMIVSTNETSGVLTHQKSETADQTVLDVLSCCLEQQNRGLVV